MQVILKGNRIIGDGKDLGSASLLDDPNSQPWEVGQTFGQKYKDFGPPNLNGDRTYTRFEYGEIIIKFFVLRSHSVIYNDPVLSELINRLEVLVYGPNIGHPSSDGQQFIGVFGAKEMQRLFEAEGAIVSTGSLVDAGCPAQDIGKVRLKGSDLTDLIAAI